MFEALQMDFTFHFSNKSNRFDSIFSLCMHRLLVATQNGFLYVYDVSEVEGGDCKLIVKHNLRNVDTQPIKIQGKFKISRFDATAFFLLFVLCNQMCNQTGAH